MKKLWNNSDLITKGFTEEEFDFLFEHGKAIIADAFSNVERWDFRCSLVELISHKGKFVIRSHPEPASLEDFKLRGGSGGAPSSLVGPLEYEELECCDICSECGRLRLEKINSWHGPLAPFRDKGCDECNTEEILQM